MMESVRKMNKERKGAHICRSLWFPFSFLFLFFKFFFFPFLPPPFLLDGVCRRCFSQDESTSIMMSARS